MSRLSRTCLALSLICLVSATILVSQAAAEVKLPAVIGPNMVLQRGTSGPFWGWADPDEQVTVSFLGQTKTAKPEAATKKWMVRLDPLQAGGPHTMTVKGRNEIVLGNVLVGEVWVCSGQSNMAMSVASSANAEPEIAAAKYPKIRLLTVPLLGTQEPQQDFQGQWAECSPQTVGRFSAAAYYFGRELHQKLDIPVGLIHCSWGGSSCEAWGKRSVLEKEPQYKPLLDRWEQTVATWDPVKAEENYKKALEAWKKKAAAAKAKNEPLPKPLRKPQNPLTGQHRPANLYNGMLLPLIPYAIRGAIWYQGESNASRAYQYRDLFPRMIQNWRADWGQGDFPFYFVQLANYKAIKPEPADSDWAELREAQTMTLKLANTGQAVIIDLGDAQNIHPTNKQDVGRRLALWALAKDYGQDVVASSPMYRSMEKKGSQVVLHFDHTGGGLVARGGEPSLKGFAIAGPDKKFVWAEARIAGDTVVVSSPGVKDPVAVRYAWADNPICHLYGQTGLPACPFRTDDWPGITAANQ